MKLSFRLFVLMCVLSCVSTFAQTTEFSYQGCLTDGSLPANATYDLAFRLFAIDSGGSPLSTLQRPAVPVSNGTFTVLLDFGSQFTGSDRYLEVAVRPTGSGEFTTLAPRQKITSAPHNIRSLSAANADAAANATNAAQLGGVAASQYVLTTDSRMTDARTPLPSSGNYIQNAVAQQSADFNIDGNGTLGGTLTANAVTATAVTAATQYNIGVNRVIALGSSTGIFVGRLAGASNTTGSGNTFVGDSAGRFTTTASNSSFFGLNAGVLNTAGDNSFFGAFAGDSNTTGTRNSFFGRTAGDANQTGNDNTFVGYNAGSGNSMGSNNTFVGQNAGSGNTMGSSNTIIGSGANVAFPNLTFATAIGAGAVVSGHNTITIGRTLDQVRVPGDINAGFLEVNGARTFGDQRIGGNLLVEGTVEVRSIFSGQSLGDLCVTDPSFPVEYRIAFCSSSLRYKDKIESYRPGRDIVRQLRPITFSWKESGKRDLGFAAEEVDEIEPLLTVRGPTGQLEGVKYKQITTVLVNAVNEQQVQIEFQRKQLDEQRKQIDALKKLVCLSNPQSQLCLEEPK